jgi:hypothetical protein
MGFISSAGSALGSTIENAEISNGSVTLEKTDGVSGEGGFSLDYLNPSVINGTWEVVYSVSVYPYTWLIRNGSAVQAANGNEINYDVFLSKGTYKLIIYFWKSSDFGILDVYYDGVEVGSQDCYAAGSSMDKVEITGITGTGENSTIRLVVDGKNGSSADYRVWITGIILQRTS